MPIDLTFSGGPTGPSGTNGLMGQYTGNFAKENKPKILGFYQQTWPFTFRSYHIILGYHMMDGTPLYLMPIDNISWDKFSEWVNENTKWPKAKIDRRNNKIYFRRKSEAMMFKLHFG